MAKFTLPRICILHCAVLACFFPSQCFPLTATASESTADTHKVEYVSNLAYGTSLYNFFQDKYFSAITDLLVAKHYNRLNTEDKNPELLLGGMYLSYGLPDNAAGIFNALLDQSSQSTSANVRDRALFHLGRHYYESGVLQPAESSLIEIGDTLSKDYDAERMYMLINIMIHNTQTIEAKELLEKIPDDSIWHAYTQYNVGTAYLRTGNYDAGTDLLNEIGTEKTTNPEYEIIRDKANIALAFSELARNNPQLANEYFSRVRINSSQTSNGLLGLGWSWYKQAHYSQALSAWITLSNQTVPSLAKQESLITIPYAYENYSQPHLALDAYDTAINIYNNELVEINKIIHDINSGKFIASLEAVSMGTESSNPASVIGNVGVASNKYLSPLFLSKDFNLAVKDLQELVFLSYTLDHWEQDIPALRLILEEKRITYNNEIEKQGHKKIINSARTLFAKRNELAEQVRNIEQNEDVTALATGDETSLLNKLASVRNSLDDINDNPDAAEQKEKYRLLNGIMKWNLETDFPVRMWQTKKEMLALNDTSEQFNQTVNALSDIFKSTPVQYADFLTRIKNRESELKQLRTEIKSSIRIQEELIAKMSLTAANQYVTKIEAYLDRALYSRARLYDAMTIPQVGQQ